MVGGGGGGNAGSKEEEGRVLSQAGMVVHRPTGELDDEWNAEKRDPGYHKVCGVGSLTPNFAAGQRCGGAGLDGGKQPRAIARGGGACVRGKTWRTAGRTRGVERGRG